MKTISIVALKGGVGKTTTAVNMATILATEYAQRVLLIDADSQGNASKQLLKEGEYNTLAALFRGGEPNYENLVYPSMVRNLDVLPSDISLISADLASIQNGGANINAIRDLRDAIMEDDAYDYIIIDCPPSFTAACAAAIAASDSIIVPIKVDMFSLSGMQELTAQIDGVRRIHPAVCVSGCLVTMYYKGDAVQQGVAYLRQEAKVPVYAAMIRRTPKVDESTWSGEAVVVWSPRSSAALDYRQFVAEFLEKEEARRHG